MSVLPLHPRDEPIYPVTIVTTRYGGTYEGGTWAAFPLDPWQVPTEPFDCDTVCRAWWNQFLYAVGVGDTPGAAHADLEAKSAQAGVRIPYEHRPQLDV